MVLTRRNVMALLGMGLPALPGLPGMNISPARAQERQFRHGATQIEPLKYTADYKHFAYVNPDAPQTGRLRLGILGTFDSLNAFTISGDPVDPGLGKGLVVESLMRSALDEPSSEYALLAEGLWFPEDFSQVVFRLNEKAQFSDGVPVTPADVIFSFEAQKANSTQAAAYYKDVIRAEQTGDREVTFPFSVKGNRELPLIMGQLSILPKQWWQASDASGKPRDAAKPTLEPLLGSGPYLVSDVKPGVSFKLKRNSAYWGSSLAINRGHHNFEEIEVQFFRDRTVIFEAFKADQFDIQLESFSKQWATGYDFPAIRDGRVKREELPRKGVSGMQCWAPNMRREKFRDARVRQALNLAFDFEWSNANLFYGLFERSRSYFNNSEFEHRDLPDAAELALLEPMRAKVPPEVFTAAFQNPVNATPQDRRKNLREAQNLLAQAGWTGQQQGQKQLLKNEKGETFAIDIVLDSQAFERVALPYKEQLELLGFQVGVRVVDLAQYERIQETHDYDMIVASWGQSLSPGNEQRSFFGSEFADAKQSQNYAGIKDEAIDQLIEKIILAPDRAALVTAVKAMDRVLMWNHYVIPMWYKATDWIAYWARVRHPETMPGYALGYPEIWWFDADGDARIKQG
jgi:microcin C transport system substrate-binding protein